MKKNRLPVLLVSLVLVTPCIAAGCSSAPNAAKLNDAAALRERGIEYGKTGEYDLAIADFTAALKINPKDAYAYCGRGLAYFIKGEYDLAITDLTQAIKLDPKFDGSYALRGEAYRMKGQYDAAISDCSEAIRLNPDLDRAYASRGRAYYQTGQTELAVQDLEKAITMNPNNEWAKERKEDIVNDIAHQFSESDVLRYAEFKADEVLRILDELLANPPPNPNPSGD
ncbi:hypothetical protein FACS189468_8640 [Spirochaetia bacterium]|nr:hypothetical protein FACS189468_8640 [Spirochaetia bacterium]